MSVMGFQKSLYLVWMGGVSSTKFFLKNLFNFAKPHDSMARLVRCFSLVIRMETTFDRDRTYGMLLPL